jgi:hypothetical protein
VKRSKYTEEQIAFALKQIVDNLPPSNQVTNMINCGKPMAPVAWTRDGSGYDGRVYTK